MNSSDSLVCGASDSTRVQAILFRVNLHPSHSSDCPPLWFVINSVIDIWNVCWQPFYPMRVPVKTCQFYTDSTSAPVLKSEPLNRCKLIKALDILGHSHILLDITGLDIRQGGGRIFVTPQDFTMKKRPCLHYHNQEPEEVRQDHVILDGPSFFNINCHSKIGNLL